MLAWQRLAVRAARREAASRRFCRRISSLPSKSYDAHLRRRKRDQRIMRESQIGRMMSVVAAAAIGVDAEGWQDVYYRELERCGEKPPPGVAQRFANSNTGYSSYTQTSTPTTNSILPLPTPSTSSAQFRTNSSLPPPSPPDD